MRVLTDKDIAEVLNKISCPGMQIEQHARKDTDDLSESPGMIRIRLDGESAVKSPRQWIIMPESTDTEIVRTAYLAMKDRIEGSLRACFGYDGAAIYNCILEHEFKARSNETCGEECVEECGATCTGKCEKANAPSPTSPIEDTYESERYK